MSKKRRNKDCKLWGRSSKKYICSLLSDKKNNIYFTNNHLNTIKYKYDSNDIVFYENKKTKKKFKNKPKDYSPKKYRKFTDVKEPRKTALKQLNKYLNELPIPNYVFAKTNAGFLKNAKYHRGNTEFILADIASFYPNCRFCYVKDFFESPSGLMMNNNTAQCMAELVTTPISETTNKRNIPQGFPTSTLISFFAYKKMFNKLNDLARKNNLKFSTYVDDLTFSSFKPINNSDKLIEEISSILSEYHHSLKKEKVKYLSVKDGKIPTITGIWVNKYKVRASTKIYKKMMKAYHFVLSTKIDSASSYLEVWKKYVQLKGLLNTVDYIEPKTKAKRKHVREIVEKNSSNFINYISPYTKKINSNYWKGKFYAAYINKNLDDFYSKNKKYFKKR